MSFNNKIHPFSAINKVEFTIFDLVDDRNEEFRL